MVVSVYPATCNPGASCAVRPCTCAEFGVKLHCRCRSSGGSNGPGRYKTRQTMFSSWAIVLEMSPKAQAAASTDEFTSIFSAEKDPHAMQTSKKGSLGTNFSASIIDECISGSYTTKAVSFSMLLETISVQTGNYAL